MSQSAMHHPNCNSLTIFFGKQNARKVVQYLFNI